MRLSIATKIFIAFMMMLVTFGAVLTFQIYQMRSIYNDVELINAGYVPLSLTLNDVKNDLRSYNVVLGEKDREVLRKTLAASRSLYNFPEQINIKLERAEGHIERQLQDPLDPAERAFLTDLLGDMRRTRELNAAFGERSDRFAEAVLEGDFERATALQTELRRMERRLATRVRASQRTVREQIDRALLRAQQGESTAFGAAVGLSLIALLVSAGIMIVIQLTIRPLRLLTEGAKRITAGDYSPIAPVRAKDEIGVLAGEFNHMVRTIADRDAALREQAGELERAYERMVATKEALIKSERLAAIGEIATKVTHELRNPLSTIRLNAEMMSDDLTDAGVPPQSEPQATLRAIIGEVERLGVLTEDYLRFARLPDPNPVPGDVSELVEAIVEFQRDDIEFNGITLDLDLNPTPTTPIDQNQLRRALINLIRNACEAMEGRPQRTLTIKTFTTDPPEPKVNIVIQDTGCGIPAEKTEFVFEPFFSMKEKGTGLGLPLTLQIVEEHNGTLTCTSAPDEGTTFVIAIPVGKESET